MVLINLTESTPNSLNNISEGKHLPKWNPVFIIDFCRFGKGSIKVFIALPHAKIPYCKTNCTRAWYNILISLLFNIRAIIKKSNSSFSNYFWEYLYAFPTSANYQNQHLNIYNDLHFYFMISTGKVHRIITRMKNYVHSLFAACNWLPLRKTIDIYLVFCTFIIKTTWSTHFDFYEI